MIYYRVAFKTGQSQTWRWRSTPLTSLNTLLAFLRRYKEVPEDRVRVFFSSTDKNMEAMLKRQNEGLMSSSITAEQFLKGKLISSTEVARLELELSTDEDHDAPYHFVLPDSLPKLLAWTKLMVKVRSGELEP